MPDSTDFACVLAAWHAHEADVRAMLRQRLRNDALADDLLQEVFLKAMRLGHGFCALDAPRAWLLRVAANAATDHQRTARPARPLDEAPEALDAADERAPVDALDACLAHALAGLSDDDRAVLEACDLQGERQATFAVRSGLSLPAAKARLRRARLRLRESLVARCGVRFDANGQVCCHAAMDQSILSEGCSS